MIEPTETVLLGVPARQVRVMVACLVLGTIERIVAGTLAPGDGLWCFARPNFGTFAQARSLLSPALDEALSAADEIDALRHLAPNALPDALERLRQAAITEMQACAERDYQVAFVRGP